IKKRLRKKYKIKCSNERVRRLMRELNLVAIQTTKFKATEDGTRSCFAGADSSGVSH
ncbi:MAG TPA: hypothetical protein DDW87_08590, partial [Firmicutes bacterium]|nr:hypothetical protein [Bacillota bacterium]